MDLKTYLAETGQTQTEFAAKVDTTVATISRIVSGVMRPGLDLAHAIERATKGKVRTETWERPAPPFPVSAPAAASAAPAAKQA